MIAGEMGASFVALEGVCLLGLLAPRVGLEPTTGRLTVACSTN